MLAQEVTVLSGLFRGWQNPLLFKVIDYLPWNEAGSNSVNLSGWLAAVGGSNLISTAGQPEDTELHLMWQVACSVFLVRVSEDEPQLCNSFRVILARPWQYMKRKNYRNLSSDATQLPLGYWQHGFQSQCTEGWQRWASKSLTLLVWLQQNMALCLSFLIFKKGSGFNHQVRLLGSLITAGK